MLKEIRLSLGLLLVVVTGLSVAAASFDWNPTDNSASDGLIITDDNGNVLSWWFWEGGPDQFGQIPVFDPNLDPLARFSDSLAGLQPDPDGLNVALNGPGDAILTMQGRYLHDVPGDVFFIEFSGDSTVGFIVTTGRITDPEFHGNWDFVPVPDATSTFSGLVLSALALALSSAISRIGIRRCVRKAG